MSRGRGFLLFLQNTCVVTLIFIRNNKTSTSSEITFDTIETDFSLYFCGIS